MSPACVRDEERRFNWPSRKRPFLTGAFGQERSLHSIRSDRLERSRARAWIVGAVAQSGGTGSTPSEQWGMSAVTQHRCRPAGSESSLKGIRLNELPRSRANYAHILADQRCLALGRFLFDVGDDVYLGTVCHSIFIRRVGRAFAGYLRHFACRLSSVSTASRRLRAMAQPFMSHRGPGRVPDHIGRHRR
jgi:hypothetical protein